MGPPGTASSAPVPPTPEPAAWLTSGETEVTPKVRRGLGAWAWPRPPARLSSQGLFSRSRRRKPHSCLVFHAWPPQSTLSGASSLYPSGLQSVQVGDGNRRPGFMTHPDPHFRVNISQLPGACFAAEDKGSSKCDPPPLPHRLGSFCISLPHSPSQFSRGSLPFRQSKPIPQSGRLQLGGKGKYHLLSNLTLNCNT